MHSSIKFIGIVFVGLLTACQNPPEKTKLHGAVFGTTYHITYNSTVNYQASIDSVFYAMNRSLSTYIPRSDISRINAGDSAVVVDVLFEEVFEKSKKIYQVTEGYFDPTVGNLVNAWGFGPAEGAGDLTTFEVLALMQFVGFDKVQLVAHQIQKEFPEMYLDFNSIAKGYGIDLVGRFLEAQQVTNYLIEIGGEIRARGVNDRGDPWRVGIDNPNTDGSRSVTNFVKLDNASMASSGNYRKFRIAKDGTKYVHTINPKTGFATESNLISATVYGAVDCADVDAYATAFMAMGFEKSKVFLDTHPLLNAILLYVNSTGELTQYSTDKTL